MSDYAFEPIVLNNDVPRCLLCYTYHTFLNNLFILVRSGLPTESCLKNPLYVNPIRPRSGSLDSNSSFVSQGSLAVELKDNGYDFDSGIDEAVAAASRRDPSPEAEIDEARPN